MSTEQEHQAEMDLFTQQVQQRCQDFQHLIKETEIQSGFKGEENELDQAIAQNSKSTINKKIITLRSALAEKREEMLAAIAFPVHDHALALKTAKGRMLTPL